MARRSALIAALLLAVLLGHALVLQWLTWQAHEQSALRMMVAPIFTRLLQQQAPPPPVADAAKPQTRRARSVIQSVAPSVPPETTSSVAPLEPAIEPPVSAPATATAAATADVAPTPDNDVAAPVAATPATSSPTATGTATASVTAGPALDSWPADTRLSYRVGGNFRGELHGTARVQWQRDGDRYQTRIDIDLGVVNLVMTSQGRVTEQGLAPSVFEETRAGKRRSAVLKDNTVTLSDGKQVPRPDGVQDTASQFVELSHQFASGRLPLEVGRSVSFWMARPGGIDFWTYDVAGKEVLQTPQLGAVEAFHLKPRPLANPRGNITAEMWFAPSLQYLPVRIRVSAGEAQLELFVEKIEQR